MRETLEKILKLAKSVKHDNESLFMESHIDEDYIIKLINKTFKKYEKEGKYRKTKHID